MGRKNTMLQKKKRKKKKEKKPLNNPTRKLRRWSRNRSIITRPSYVPRCGCWRRIPSGTLISVKRQETCYKEWAITFLSFVSLRNQQYADVDLYAVFWILSSLDTFGNYSVASAPGGFINLKATKKQMWPLAEFTGCHYTILESLWVKVICC